jgi:hypothetical protein
MCVYENRDQLYLAALREPVLLYRVLDATLSAWLIEHAAGHDLHALMERARAVLAIDAAFCPRVGAPHTTDHAFDFDAERVAYHLNRMELPGDAAFSPGATSLRIQHPGGVGEILKDPDGGSWFRGQIHGAHGAHDAHDVHNARAAEVRPSADSSAA